MIFGMTTFTFVHVVLSLIGIHVFVLIAQLFARVPGLKALAPTQSEPPFLVSQLVCMAIFIVLAIAAAKKFRVAPALAT
jgi:hypothetical protein